MRKYFGVLNRRRFFCCSIAGLAINALRARLPVAIEQGSNLAPANREFLIINGWILTTEDMTASKMTSNVV
jgi:hypothetical protein